MGVWGPGDIVIPDLLALQEVELRALSDVRVHEWRPNPDEHQCCAMLQIQQLGIFLQLSRIRPAEARLFRLLMWLGERFGARSEHGCSVPLDDMNLTHRQLAETTSLSRVTVTKALGQFRQQAWLVRLGDEEVLTAAGINLFQHLE